MLVARLTAIVLLVSLSALSIVGCSDATIAAPSSPEVRVDRSDATTVTIQVAPATLVLGSPGPCLTVHAEIAFSAVSSGSVSLNGIVPYATFSDSRGQLVAKFVRDDIEAIAAPPEITLTLEGSTVAGVSFSGTDTIAVK